MSNLAFKETIKKNLAGFAVPQKSTKTAKKTKKAKAGKEFAGTKSRFGLEWDKDMHVATSNMTWLKMLLADEKGNFFTKNHKYIYTEIAQEELSFANGRRPVTRNILKVYVESLTKEQLDRIAARNGLPMFNWFAPSHKPFLVITDSPARNYKKTNEVVLLNPSDFYKYADYLIKQSEMTYRHW